MFFLKKKTDKPVSCLWNIMVYFSASRGVLFVAACTLIIPVLYPGVSMKGNMPMIGLEIDSFNFWPKI